jgi:magnesium chelatase family protein
LKAHCAIDDASLDLMKFAMSDMHMSARAFHRILKVARTIADLAGSEAIVSNQVCESI